MLWWTLRQFDSGRGMATLKAEAKLRATNGEGTLEPLLQRLRNPSHPHRDRVARLLGQFQRSEAVDDLIQAADTTDPQVKAAVVWALAQIGDSRATETILPAFRAMRGEAELKNMTGALGRMKDPRAVSALTTCATTSAFPSVRAAAAEALKRIDDQEAVVALADALDTNPGMPGLSEAADVLRHFERSQPGHVNKALVTVRVIQEQRLVAEEKRRKAEAEALAREQAAFKTQREAAVLALRQCLHVGMMLSEVTAVLGSTYNQMDLLGKRYRVWRRPEGEWKLIFVGERLDDIYQAPM